MASGPFCHLGVDADDEPQGQYNPWLVSMVMLSPLKADVSIRVRGRADVGMLTEPVVTVIHAIVGGGVGRVPT
jgi:hypothetical protein